jgi:hypothetical protein
MAIDRAVISITTSGQPKCHRLANQGFHLGTMLFGHHAHLVQKTPRKRILSIKGRQDDFVIPKRRVDRQKIRQRAKLVGPRYSRTICHFKNPIALSHSGTKFGPFPARQYEASPFGRDLRLPREAFSAMRESGIKVFPVIIGRKQSYR